MNECLQHSYADWDQDSHDVSRSYPASALLDARMDYYDATMSCISAAPMLQSMYRLHERTNEWNDVAFIDLCSRASHVHGLWACIYVALDLSIGVLDWYIWELGGSVSVRNTPTGSQGQSAYL